MNENVPSLKEIVRQQRDFIHDLASPIMIAKGMLDTAINLIEKGDCSANAIDKLQRSSKNMDRISDLLKSHRTNLVELTKKLDQDDSPL